MLFRSIHNNNNTNYKGNSKKNQSNSINSEVNDVIILPNTPEGKMIPMSQYLCNTEDKEKMKTNENIHEYGDEHENNHEKSHKKRENLDERRYKKKPLRLENLLKSFFSEEERDLSCDQCKDPKARAKVSNRFMKFLGRKRRREKNFILLNISTFYYFIRRSSYFLIS